jgi:hypothetical protein
MGAFWPASDVLGMPVSKRLKFKGSTRVWDESVTREEYMDGACGSLKAAQASCQQKNLLPLQGFKND